MEHRDLFRGSKMLTENYDTTVLKRKNPSKKIVFLARHQVLVDHSGHTWAGSLGLPVKCGFWWKVARLVPAI